ncbi:hypothetical protein CJF30_00008118 [Rutstroemia sp. NJR-2017a BBW]|nr:hypothetical protein CJF30_00008118 [Rutstroemia sp. NJR-2017a BBW]
MGEPTYNLRDTDAERVAFEKLRKGLRMRDPQECFMALVELSAVTEEATEHERASSLLLQISPNTFSEILRLYTFWGDMETCGKNSVHITREFWVLGQLVIMDFISSI